jgi:hypothetical protein
MREPSFTAGRVQVTSGNRIDGFFARANLPFRGRQSRAHLGGNPMRNYILPLALASALVVPVLASAQERTGSGSVEMHPHSQPPKTPEEVMAGLDTAKRAQKLREADATTRKAFGAYQKVVAEARLDGAPTDTDASAVLAVNAQSAAREQVMHFGEDSNERAQQLRDVGKATRRAFDKFQAAVWREQDLAEAAGPDARVEAFGPEAPPASPVAQDQPPATSQ